MRWVEEGEFTNIYQCAGCRRWRPWCDGAHDDMPDHCDRCWAEAHWHEWKLSWWGRLRRWLGLQRGWESWFWAA